MNAGEQQARRAARLAWLAVHGTHLPGAYGFISNAQRADLEAARLAMIAAGLAAKTNEPHAARWGLRRLLSDSRGEPRPTPVQSAQQRWTS